MNLHHRLANPLTTIVLLCLTAFCWLSASAAEETAQCPWDMQALSKAPATWPADAFKEEGLTSLFYDGLPYQGKPTRVFAWYGAPATKPGEKLPAMVLVHGGGGTAFPQWVRLWNARGYAAIAMDTCGCLPVGENPNRPHHEFSGPMGWGDFEHVEAPAADQWSYHAVADVILAHSLLRAKPEIDPDRIGLTGISWGGYLTCISASVDRRFRFAAPVYGCGFLGEDSAWVKGFQEMGQEKAGKWLRLWDPSVYLPRAEVPFLWVTGTNEECYPLGSYQKTYRLPKSPRTLCIRVRMPHAHEPGWQCEEVYAYADSILKSAARLPLVTSSGADGAAVWTNFESKTPLKEAQLNYTLDSGPWPKREWKTIAATVDEQSHKIKATLPESVTAYYFNLVDERGLLVSSEHAEINLPSH